MATWFAKELLFILSLASMAQEDPASAPQLTRTQGVHDLVYKVFREEQTSSTSWKRFDNERLEASKWSVPLLNALQTRDLAGWSCGPGAITQAVTLVTGNKPFSNSVQYMRFALGVPKGLGTYHDHRFDPVMPFNSALLEVIYSPLWMLKIPQTLQSFLSAWDLKTGAPPQWLAQYMSAYAKAGNRMGELEFVHYGTNNFNDLWRQITLHLDSHSGVIPLVASGALQWHYLNVVGYNPDTRQVLILDRQRLMKWRTQRLQALMYMGFNESYYHPGEYAAFAAGSLVNWLSTVNDYNVIFVRPKGVSVPLP